MLQPHRRVLSYDQSMTTKTQSSASNVSKLLVALVLPFAAGAIGSLATNSEITTWYADLAKPAFNPPNWIFGPVWSALYLLQGIAFYLVIRQPHRLRGRATVLFLLQLVANTLWSLTFFGAHAPAWALADITILWALIVATIFTFWSIRSVSAVLLIPYLAWVTFATALNIGIIALNS